MPSARRPWLSLPFVCCVSLLGAAPKPNANTAPYPYGNPVITHLYTADAAPHVMPDGRVWMVTSVDHEDGGGYGTMHAIHAFSTADMVHWVDEGELLSLADLNEPPGEDWAIWAPDIAYRYGRYHLVFPLRNILADGTIDRYLAVAESDSLHHRFTVTQPRMRTVPKAGLDPSVFIDDDGIAYLYYNQSLMGVLDDAMHELAEGPFKLEIGADNFMEAAWMHKRSGRYYFNYHTKYDNQVDPANPDDPARRKSRLDYSVGDSPRGPLTYGGMLNDELGVGIADGPRIPGQDWVPWRLTQSNHGGVVEYHGQDYLFYHTSALSSWRQDAFKGPGTWTQRSVCVDLLHYAPDGSVIPVQQTLTSVPAVRIDQPFAIPLATPTALTGAHLDADGSIVVTADQAVLSFRSVPLGSGYYYFDAGHDRDAAAFRIAVRLDTVDGPLAGTARRAPDPARADWKAETFLREARGSRDVHLVISRAPAATGELRLRDLRFFAGSPLPR